MPARMYVPMYICMYVYEDMYEFAQSVNTTKQSHIKLLFLQLLNEWNIAVNAT